VYENYCFIPDRVLQPLNHVSESSLEPSLCTRCCENEIYTIYTVSMRLCACVRACVSDISFPVRYLQVLKLTNTCRFTSFHGVVLRHRDISTHLELVGHHQCMPAMDWINPALDAIIETFRKAVRVLAFIGVPSVRKVRNRACCVTQSHDSHFHSTRALAPSPQYLCIVTKIARKCAYFSMLLDFCFKRDEL